MKTIEQKPTGKSLRCVIKKWRLCLLASAFVLATGAFVMGPLGSQKVHAATPDGTDIVMRMKLDLSQQVLRALALEDFGALETNAVRLAKLSEMAGWQARNTPEYTWFSAEFRRSAEELAHAARAKNVDGATVAYTQMTFSCVSCHKYMRKSRVEKTGLSF